LSRRIYAAFLIAAAIPTAIAGVIGIYVSMQTLREETLSNLEQEVQVRAQGVGRFLDQLAAELRYLAGTREVRGFAAALADSEAPAIAIGRQRLEHDYAALAALYPHIYQIRFIDAGGREQVRVDRRDGGVLVVDNDRLQSKADRYYVREALALPPGSLYVSPLDLNVEFGRVEKPERPVIRVATPVADRHGGVAGLLIINLHADILLDPIQQIAERRRGTAYLLDRAGHFVARSAGDPANAFAMEPVATLRQRYPASLVDAMASGLGEPQTQDGWIVASARVGTVAAPTDAPAQWTIALAYPERQLFIAIFNLYMLYGVLAAGLLVTAGGGYLLSRRLLGPLEDLARESEAIAGGDFGRRVRIGGRDEIAALGQKFNAMAAQLDASYRAINAHREQLEAEVRARTRDLERERRALEAIIGHTADGIVAVDAGGTIRVANPAARALFAESDPVGTPLERFWPQWPAIAATAAGDTASGGGKGSGGEIRCDIEQGIRVLALAVTPTADGCIVVARDVSHEREIADERRELDRQMFQMEKLTTLGELAMGLAHEIGNPLAGMKAVTQAMQYEEDIPPGLLEALKRLEAEVDRLSGFLRSFHGFAAPRAIATEPCPLAPTLDDVLFWTRKEARSQGIEIETAGVGNLPALRADPQQLKQVLLNLLMNAVHAMPDGGRLSVRATADGQNAQIDIADTGCGIPPEVRERIFEPFFTTRREGTGLGLSIVRKIVEQHGGSIAVASDPGHGSCFTIRWPLAAPNPPATPSGTSTDA
jgi:signal transduction histidine kinase